METVLIGRLVALANLRSLEGYNNEAEVINEAVKVLQQPEQHSVIKHFEPVAAVQLLNRLERQWHRMGELWERCQGKGWPTAESDEFTALRDEKTPSNRRALLDLYAATPQRKPLTDEQIEAIKILADDYARKCAEFARCLAVKMTTDSMSPVAMDAGDARLKLHQALEAAHNIKD